MTGNGAGGSGADTGFGTVTGAVAFFFGKTLGSFLTYPLLLVFGFFKTRKVKEWHERSRNWHVQCPCFSAGHSQKAW